MNESLPSVSVLVPTLNSARTLGACLDSVRAQDWPAGRLEIVLADAGSTDGTIGIARERGVEKIVGNPLRTGEAGKTAAAKAASGDLLALVDSDNVLPDPGWLRRMVAPFADPAVAAAEPLGYAARPEDPPLVRYFARLGMNDPFCLFVGNYDRRCAVTGRWTELPVEAEDRGGWLAVRLVRGRPFPTIGANGFLIRRSLLPRTRVDPYWFDVDVLQDLAATSPDGAVTVAKVDTDVVHLYCDSFEAFRRKQERRVRDFLHFSGRRAEPARPGVPPAGRPPLLRGIVRFSLAVLLGFPLARQARRGAAASPDPEAWALHAKACRLTFRVYAAAALRRVLRGRGAPADRSAWRQ
ncbi:MAG: glycosyltransferase [Kiritimatiellae bacterium]|nr:glycosyltransferase [Kiritimatiellia bacterium]